MKEQNKKNKQIKLSLETDQNVEQYVNFAITTHSPAEFVVDAPISTSLILMS